MEMIWQIGNCTPRDVYALYPDPKPHINTIATMFQSLERKGYLTHQMKGRGYLYIPTMDQKDYGRGNILFAKTETGVKLDIVDLNRMYVGPIDIKRGCKNFERLPATPHMHRLMAEEYAAARGFDADECFRLMQAYRSTQPGKINGLY